MSAQNDSFEALFSGSTLDLDAVGAALDAMDDAARPVAVRRLGKAAQRKLWDAAEGRGTSLSDIVPPSVPPATEVIHAGRNSLPAFRIFEKRFCRVAGDDSVLYGYNEGSTRPVVGPGYFVAHYFEERGEVGVDYFQVPPGDAALPDGWPTVKPNEAGLQRFVYAKMVDYLRKVSSHVTIGRAWRNGKMTSNFFLLCRTGP